MFAKFGDKIAAVGGKYVSSSSYDTCILLLI
jgi:hypothetical protein